VRRPLIRLSQSIWEKQWRKQLEKGLEIPYYLYHVTPNADKIFREGFKTAEILGVSGFGGHGTYVSLTTLDNARIYKINMMMMTAVVNGYATPLELKEFIITYGGRSAWYGCLPTAFDNDRYRFEKEHPNVRIRYPTDAYSIEQLFFDELDYDGSKVSKDITIERMYSTLKSAWPFAEKDKQGYLVLWFGYPSILKGKIPNDIKIIEVHVEGDLKFHSEVNFPWHDPHGWFTYNPAEDEWRIFDLDKIIPLDIVE